MLINSKFQNYSLALSVLCIIATLAITINANPLTSSSGDNNKKPFQDGLANYYEFVHEIESDGEKKKDNTKQPMNLVKADQVIKQQVSQEDMDLAMQVSLNNPEFRLIGSNQKPVRMRDDMQTKVVVALENLKKDAGELWGTVSVKLADVGQQVEKGWAEAKVGLDKGWAEAKVGLDKGLVEVNGQLDKGWTEIKSIFDKVVTSAKKQAASTTTAKPYEVPSN